MNISTSPKTEHKSVKRRQPINKQGRGGKGYSEPGGVEGNPDQLHNRRRWRNDERQKDVREPTDRQEKKALSRSRYSNTADIITSDKSSGTEAKNNTPDSTSTRTRNLSISEEPLDDHVYDSVNDETIDVSSDVTGIQTEIPPSSEQSDMRKKRKKRKRHKKSPSEQRRSMLRHHKNPFIIDDDVLMVSENDDDNFEGDDEQESSSDDFHEKKKRAGKRKKTRRSSRRRGPGPSSSDDDGKIVGPLPPLHPSKHQPLIQQPQTQQTQTQQLQTQQPPVHQAQTNPQVQANTRLRNIPEEYRNRADALRTRSPTDYMLNGFSQASMRVFDFATGANAECTYNTRGHNHYESYNRNTSCVASQLPPLIARGIVSGGCVQPTSQLVDDDPERGQDFSPFSGRSRSRNFQLY